MPRCRSERKGPRCSYQPGSKTRHRLPAARPGAAAVSAAWGWGGEGELGDPEVPVEGWVRERRLGAEAKVGCGASVLAEKAAVPGDSQPS